MKTTYKKQKRDYTKPQVANIKLDNEISIFMLSPGSDPPETSLPTDHFAINPFKLPKL